MKRLIYFLMTLLGFGAIGCDSGMGMVEYGCPNVNFRVTARVVDEAGKPIEGIRVGIYQERWDGGYECEDFEDRTGYTDYRGYIDARSSPFSVPKKLLIEDVDGEANGGEFEHQIINVVDFTQTEEGDGNWYGGGYEVHIGDVTMKLKATNSEDDNNEATQE